MNNLQHSFLSDQEKSDADNFQEYWRITKKYKKSIFLLVLLSVLITVAISLSMDDVYESSAIITPQSDLKDKMGSLSSLASQFTGLTAMAGIQVPGAASLYELEALLNSNNLMGKIIVRNNLLPILFDDNWDDVNKQWKQPNFITKKITDFKKKIKSSITPIKKNIEESDAPTVWEGIRQLDRMTTITRDQKSNLITITVDFRDAEMSAKIADYYLDALSDYMCSEARRVANINRQYLEAQLVRAVDPVVRQKIYTLLSQQIETALMAEVKENFAFKVVDRPMIPDKKIKPKRALLVFVSLFTSLFSGIAISVYRENLDGEQKFEKEINEKGHGISL